MLVQQLTYCERCSRLPHNAGHLANLTSRQHLLALPKMLALARQHPDFHTEFGLEISFNWQSSIARPAGYGRPPAAAQLHGVLGLLYSAASSASSQAGRRQHTAGRWEK
jgi:hypothetical protein